LPDAFYGVSLEDEFSDKEVNTAIIIELDTMPLNKNILHSHCKSKKVGIGFVQISISGCIISFRVNPQRDVRCSNRKKQ